MIQIHVQVWTGSETPVETSEQSREVKERTAHMDYCRTIFDLRQKLMRGQDKAYAEKD